MKRFQPPAPKPFNFVRLQRPTRSKLGANQHWQHDSYATGEDFFTGRMTCEMEALTHIHIGSGTFELLGGEVVKGFIRRNGRLIIPGSSLKGVVRSVAEAISQSCICKIGRAGKDLMPRYKNWRERFDECSPPRANKEGKVKAEDYDLCIACSIFGGMGYQGRVHFEDAVPVDFQTGRHAIPSLFAPGRDRRLRKYRDERNNTRGRKFYYHGKMAKGREPHEVILQGSKLSFEFGFTNLRSDELCLLLTSMGVVGDKPFVLKIGGGKPVCLGSTKVHISKTRLRESLDKTILAYSGSETEWLSDSPQLIEFLEKISSSKTLIRENAVSQLQTIWQHPSEKQCPANLY